MDIDLIRGDFPSPLPRQSVLVVDDSPTDALYLRKLLEQPDRHILTARSGEEALNVLKGFECALILLDIELEGLNGFQTAERIRANERTRNLPIIFISATNREQEHVFRGYDAGAVDYLFKPVEPNLLRSKVSIFCELAAQRFVIQEQLSEIQAKNEVLLQQLEEIKTLRGLVPICARCKNVRDDSGFWQTIEAYVCEHSEAEFSHSLCPECANMLYPGIGATATTAAGVRAGRRHG
jgi:CheY-like chemotaxis protein